MIKPTGKNGALKISATSSGVKSEFVKIIFPQKKEEIEKYIVDKFIASYEQLTKAPCIFKNPIKLDENNFYFKVTTKRGPGYLELTEIAPINGKKESYNSAPKAHDVKEKIDEVYKNQILKKSEKYKAQKNKYDIFLLLYTTHYNFDLSDIEISYLIYLCSKGNFLFRAIFLYTPLTQDTGEPKWIYPVPPQYIQSFEGVGKIPVLHLDPEAWPLITSQNTYVAETICKLSWTETNKIYNPEVNYKIKHTESFSNYLCVLGKSLLYLR